MLDGGVLGLVERHDRNASPAASRSKLFRCAIEIAARERKDRKEEEIKRHNRTDDRLCYLCVLCVSFAAILARTGTIVAALQLPQQPGAGDHIGCPAGDRYLPSAG